MNTSPIDDEDRRWRERLRAAEPMPARTPDLWPAIAARLEPRTSARSSGGVPQAALAEAVKRHRPRRRSRVQSLLAMACLLMLVVLAVPLNRSMPDQSSAQAQPHPLDTLLLREAEGLEREYAAAFAQFEGAPLPEAFEPGLQALDVEGRRIHAALTHSPDQPRLLDELRRVHERRLQLLRRSLEIAA